MWLLPRLRVERRVDVEPARVWGGGGAIARRVHAVHNGSSLVYPLQTVGYSNGDPEVGRNWDITFPQDVRNCDGTCTALPDTSGTWATKPSRLPVMAVTTPTRRRRTSGS